MGVHVLDETGSMTCEKYRSASSSSLSARRIIGAPMRSWKSRSKSQSRLAIESRCNWSSEGIGRWRNNQGHVVLLSDVPLMQVSEPERVALQKLAISKLQEMNLGCPLEVPKSECLHVQQPKKRMMLLKKKAVTSAIVDSKDKPKGSSTLCSVFGVPISQCIAADRMRASDYRPEQRDHCEEVLSALRLSSRKNSPEEINLLSPTRNSSSGSLADLQNGEPQVPLVVQSCIKFLETRGLETLGIFRVSGSQKRVRQLREDLDTARTFSFEDSTQPHDVAQLLKEYFRDLPEPLLPRSLYRPFLMTQRITDYQKRMKAVRWLLYLLPVAHRDTLAVLLAFLHKITQFAEASPREDGTWVSGNKMDTNNLATVFGPNLLRMSKGSTDSPYAVHSVQRAQERSDVILTIRMLIENHQDLFQVPVEDLDAVYHQMMTEDPDTLNAILLRLLECSRIEDNAMAGSYGISYEENLDNAFTITTQKSSFYSHSGAEQPEKRSETLADWSVQSRIRPLLFEKDAERQRSLLQASHHPTERVIESSRIGDRLLGSTSTRRADYLASQPFGVTASFTITMAGKGNQCVTDILPQTTTSEQESTSKARRVPYGKLRHMTSPAYVTEETITTIIIPPPRNISSTRGDSGSYKSLLYTPVKPWELGEAKSSSDGSSYKSRLSVERQAPLQRAKVAEQVSGASHPAVPERWKRQEIIASEHIQL